MSSSVVLLVSFTISPVAGISYVSLFYRLRITRTVRPAWVIAPISCSIVQRVCSRKALFVRKVFISCNDHSDLRQSDVKVSLIPFYLIFYWYTFSIVLSHLFCYGLLFTIKKRHLRYLKYYWTKGFAVCLAVSG